jgi:cobalt-zinc-cadmium efflux system outer membrane protein
MDRVRLASSCAFAGVLIGAATIGGHAQSAPPPGRLSLQAAVDALVAGNLPVLAARYNVDALRAQRVAAALKPDPTLVVSATQFTIPRVLSHPAYAGVQASAGAILNTQYTVEVDRVLERGDKRRLRVGEADLQTAIGEAQLANALREQTLELKQTFMAAVLARDNLRVYRENLDGFTRMQQVFAAQASEGYTAGVDVRRVGIELVDVQGRVSTTQADYIQDVRDVLNLIGRGEDAAIETATADGADDGPDALDATFDVPPIGLDLAALRALALAHRPDLREARLGLDAAGEALKLAQATRTRDVTLGAQYTRSGPDNAVGVVFGVPLTTARRADAAVAQAAALQKQADARFHQVRAQVLTDVEKAFVAYRISRDRLHLFDDQVLRQASEVRSIEQVAYREGERGLLNVLDAQRAYNATRVDYNETRHAFAMSVYQLEAATGTNAAVLTGAGAASGASR